MFILEPEERNSSSLLTIQMPVSGIMPDPYHIFKVYEGLEDADAGRLITTPELLERIDHWVVNGARDMNKAIREHWDLS